MLEDWKRGVCCIVLTGVWTAPYRCESLVSSSAGWEVVGETVRHVSKPRPRLQTLAHRNAGAGVVTAGLPKASAAVCGMRTVHADITRWHSCPGVLLFCSLACNRCEMFNDVPDRIPFRKTHADMVILVA